MVDSFLTCLFNLAEEYNSLSSLPRSLMERFRYFLNLDHAAQTWCKLLVDGLSVSYILGLSTSNQQNIKTERFSF